MHVAEARSTCQSEKGKSTSHPEHFWKLRCRKSARRCGVKHVSKSKCTKHTNLGPLLEVVMLKRSTPLWREAHFEVKILKHWRSQAVLEIEMVKKCASSWHEAHFEVKRVQNWRSRTTFGEMVKKCTPLWREAHFEVKSVDGLRPFLEVGMVKNARPCGAKHMPK